MRYKEPFIEGWWLDVGIDQAGGISEILNCSFIAIVWEDEEFKIEGRTWEKNSRIYHHWDSIFAELKGSRLHFSYEFTTHWPDSRPKGDETASFKFELNGQNFHGRYDGGRFTSNGVLKRKNHKLFGSRYRLPPWSEREQMAREFMAHYASINNYDPQTLRLRLAEKQKIRRYDYFDFAFMTVQQQTLKRRRWAAANSIPRPLHFGSTLDIGAGDGTLSVAALKSLHLDDPSTLYVAIDPNGFFLEDLSVRLRNDAGRVEGNNTHLIRETFEAFLTRAPTPFDLILCFHCLYYLSDPDQALDAIFGNLLRDGGWVLFMHTDILSQRSQLLNKLAKYYNPELERGIVRKIDEAATRHKLRRLMPFERDVVITCPTLTRDGWQRVVGNGEGAEVRKAIELISFLVDRAPDQFIDPSYWRACVNLVRRHAKLGGNEITLPQVLQIYQKV